MGSIATRNEFWVDRITGFLTRRGSAGVSPADKDIKCIQKTSILAA